MMAIKRNTKKKAFTLVELLVVIAILGIIVTVSVIGYAKFIKKANMSVDEQFVAQMNKVLETEEGSGNVNTNVADAREMLRSNGVNTFETTYVLNVFYWVKSENRMIIWTKDGADDLNSGKVTFPEKYAKDESWAAKTPATEAAEENADWFKLSASDRPEGENYQVVPVQANLTALAEAIADHQAGDPVVLQIPENATISLNDENAITEFAGMFAGENDVGRKAIIDLNHGKLEKNHQNEITIPAGAEVELRNGEFNCNGAGRFYGDITGGDGSKLTLRNMSVNSNSTPVHLNGSMSAVTIENCTIIAGGTYAVATNSSTTQPLRADIRNSYIKGHVAVCINTDVTVNISGTTMEGDVPFMLRAGTANIADSVIRQLDPDPGWASYKNFFQGTPYYSQFQGNFQSGDGVPAATLMLGEYSDEARYGAPTKCDLKNVRLESSNTDEVPTVLCAAKVQSKTVTFTYDESSDIGTIKKYGDDSLRTDGVVINNEGSITVNGEAR